MKLIKFSAEWCAPCKALAKTLSRMGLSYAEYDADEDVEDFGMYNITTVPVLMLVDDMGHEIDRLTGNVPSNKIQEFLNKNNFS